eukprot:1157991-Pelagomonas_calceolata.AAC.2
MFKAHGIPSAGMAVFDTMRHVRPDVSTCVIGMAASMGAFILASGQQVCVCKNDNAASEEVCTAYGSLNSAVKMLCRCCLVNAARQNISAAFAHLVVSPCAATASAVSAAFLSLLVFLPELWLSACATKQVHCAA